MTVNPLEMQGWLIINQSDDNPAVKAAGVVKAPHSLRKSWQRTPAP
jgi:hypothetical protein